MNPRRLVVLRGAPEGTEREARKLLEGLARDRALWVSAAKAGPLRRALGGTYDAVVLDGHEDLNPDLLALCHGLIPGGGALVLLLGPTGTTPPGRAQRLAAEGVDPADVTAHFWHHFERALARAESADLASWQPLQPAAAFEGTADQAHAVTQLKRVLTGTQPAWFVLTGGRGRGKSAALGLALAAAGLGERVGLLAGAEGSAAEVRQWAGSQQPTWVTATELLSEQAVDRFDALVIDEAARLPVPVMQRLVGLHGHRSLVFSTTTHGYEGTGRGFALRFTPWLRARAADKEIALVQFALATPIRYPAHDPIERFIFDALLLDAQAGDPQAGSGPPTVRELDRGALVQDEGLLRDLFGLMVEAHYRTTPADLERLLDAPNMGVHGVFQGERLVGATLVALEGELPPETIDGVASGRLRLRGHALAETLIAHHGRPEAGRLQIVRSVRIAVHPGLRLQGLGARLVDHVHHCYQPDLFGTLFGGTEGLLRFRRQVGYRLIRVGSSRGSRTGEPAFVMVRPVSEEAQELVAGLQAELARELPGLLDLLAADGDLLLEASLREALLQGLPDPAPLDETEVLRLVTHYANSARPFESVAGAVTAFVKAHESLLAGVDARDAAVVRVRVLERGSWIRAHDAGGHPSFKMTMRAVRQTVRRLLELTPSGTTEAPGQR